MFNIRKNNHFYEKIGKKGEEVCIDDEIPWDIPDSWEWCKLGNLISIITGVSYKKGDVTSEGLRVLRGGNIQDTNVLLLDDDVYLPESYYDPIKEIRKGDILIVASTGSKKVIGKPGFVNENYENISIGAFLRICRPIINYLSEYIQLIFASEYYRNHIRTLSQGTNINNVKKEYLENLFVPLPPLKEQEMILTKINHLLPFIEQYGIFEEELDSLNIGFPTKIKDSILQDAVQGKLVSQDPNDEPASVLLERIKEEKEQLIKAKKIKRNKNESFIFKENNHFYEKIGRNKIVCIDDEIQFDIPNSWQWCRLGDLVYNFGQKKPDKTFSYVDVGSIDNKNLKLDEKETILTKEEAPSRARKIIKEGSIIYSTVRPYLLNMCIIDKEFSHEPIASTAFAILNPFKGFYNKYLFYYLQSPTFINYVNSVMSGVAYPAINDKKLYNALISLPPLEEQKRIVDKINELLKF